MGRDLLGFLNWIDAIVLIIIIRTAFVGFRRGAVSELLITIGFFILCIISIQYYSQVGQFISYYIQIPLKYSRILSYFVIIGGGFVLIWLASRAITILVDFKGLSIANKSIGIIFGTIKGFVVCNIFLFLLLMMDIDYLSYLIEASYSGSFIVSITPKVHELIKSLFSFL